MAEGVLMMKNVPKLVVLFVFALPLISFSQSTTIKGVLISLNDKSPIAYANIGILNTPVGTISNDDGTFELSVPEKFKQDEVLFAALGYERRSFRLSELLARQDNVIALTEQITVLHNVTVKSP